MHAHFVLAHPEAKSFNGHLVRTGMELLKADGWSTSLSNLYAMGFDPCERAEFYADRAEGGRFDVQLEQRHATETGTLPKEVQDELNCMDRADLLILQYPMWWHMPPAILKGWFDRVWAYGSAYSSSKRFEDGRFVGRRAMLSVTVGTSRETYEYNGRSGDISLLLWPINFNLAYLGFTVLTPFVTYGVEAGLRYSTSEEIESRLDGATIAFCDMLRDGAKSRGTIPFNRRADWEASGHIRSDAPAFSPFIRHLDKIPLSERSPTTESESTRAPDQDL